MTQPQILAFAIIAVMMVLFIWGRLRYDLVALLALLASLAAGTVSAKDAFSGFADDIVIIVWSALIVSAAVARSGIVESLLAGPTARAGGTRRQLTLLVVAVAALSAIVKNIGALAMLMPAALRMAKKSGVSPSLFLMPMAFASLLGGLTTLVGTSPNIIVSRVREQMTGQPFGMFDYTPVGLALVVVGILFLAVAYPLIPKDRRAAPTMGEALNIEGYTTEASVAPGSAAIGKDASGLEAVNDGEVEVVRIMRDRRSVSRATPLAEGDTILLKGDPEALERAIAASELALQGQHRALVAENAAEDVGVIEAVVTGESVLVGRAASQIGLHDTYGVNLLAVSRSGERISERIGEMWLRAGDVVVLQGPLERLPRQLQELGCLPLAERPLRLGGVRRARAAGHPAGRHDRHRDRPGARRHRLLRCGCARDAQRRAAAARGLRSRRLADPHHAGRPHPRERGPAQDRRHGPDGGLALVRRDGASAMGRGRPHHGRRHGRDAVPQQCRDGSRHGAGGGDLRAKA